MTPTSGAMQTGNMSMPTATQPIAKVTMTPAAVVSPPTAMMQVLARDTFQRTNQAFWGTASDGHMWGASAATVQNFAIVGDACVITNGPGAFDATLGPRTTDAEIVFSASLSSFSNGNSNIGAVLHWTDTNNWYKAYIEGNQLILLKKVGGMLVLLNAVPFMAQAGMSYTLRFRTMGSTLAAKAWATGQAEPANWMVMATDTALTTGFGGIRLVIQKGVTARVTMFTETKVM